MHNAFIAALPFCVDGELWEDLVVAAMEVDGDGAMGTWRKRVREAKLISYREYTDRWSEGRVKRAGIFEKMLLVGCQARRVVEERLREMQREESLRTRFRSRKRLDDVTRCMSGRLSVASQSITILCSSFKHSTVIACHSLSAKNIHFRTHCGYTTIHHECHLPRIPFFHACL